MNKKALVSELSKIGIKINSFKFNSAGYCLELRLEFFKASDWEELDKMTIDGLEMTRVRQIGERVRRVILIPSNEREFEAYVNRYVSTYNMHKTIALQNLACIINAFGSASAKAELANYLKKRNKEMTAW